MINYVDLFSTYKNRRVLLTGHTGFKGSWLSLWLNHLGAHVTGVSLDPPTSPSLFNEAQTEELVDDRRQDIRDIDGLRRIFNEVNPDMVFHLAAQPLVRDSYSLALETLDINIMGSAHIFQACREQESVQALVHVSTDKCYENPDTEQRAHPETDPMGGFDPYSASKGAAEIVFSSYDRSFFMREGQLLAASGRAGNVLGGGDWARDRIVPDVMRALNQAETVGVRNTQAVRPWQHVLEALSGYMTLGAFMLQGDGQACGAWNFGPDSTSVRTVKDLVEGIIGVWGEGSWEDQSDPSAAHESAWLSLDCSKAKSILGWAPRWGYDETVRHVTQWYKSYYEGQAARELCLADIEAYTHGLD